MVLPNIHYTANPIANLFSSISKNLTTATLITVPTFTFNQGDVFQIDADSERPIHVDFYRGSIELRQDGDYKEQECILISTAHLEKLFKEIKKHLPEATKRWEDKK